VRLVLAVLVSVVATVTTAIFLIVLITKLTVLHEDRVALFGVASWFVLALTASCGARSAWRRVES
jgi:hypothetical protein